MKGRWSFPTLLLCLVILLLAYPAVEQSAWADKALALFLTVVLIASVYATHRTSRFAFRIAVALAIMSFLFLWLSKFVPDGTPLKLRLSVLDNLAEVMFLFFTAGCILKYLLTRDRITLDILSGAACVYILFGISWGVLYSFLERVAPGSFAFAGHFSPEQKMGWPIFNYYSFVTLTTLGYGEITPVTARAQSFAIIEAVTGVLFTALLISRLVGVYISQNIASRREG